jgi:hypothetical protein
MAAELARKELLLRELVVTIANQTGMLLELVNYNVEGTQYGQSPLSSPINSRAPSRRVETEAFLPSSCFFFGSRRRREHGSRHPHKRPQLHQGPEHRHEEAPGRAFARGPSSKGRHSPTDPLPHSFRLRDLTPPLLLPSLIGVTARSDRGPVVKDCPGKGEGGWVRQA